MLFGVRTNQMQFLKFYSKTKGNQINLYRQEINPKNLAYDSQRAAFKGTARTATVAFSTGERAFVVMGKSSIYRFDDIWKLHPNKV